MTAWLWPRVLLVICVIGVLVLIVKVQRFFFNDCLNVGHVMSYCVAQYPLGAHR